MISSLRSEPKEWNEFPCPYCGGQVIYTSNSYIYHGRTYGNGMCYVCQNCRASVGVHGVKGNHNIRPTKRPLGLLATSEMKLLKQECHERFDRVWHTHLLKRRNCYKQLSMLMGIPSNCCHFGWFNEDDLKKAKGILKNPNWWKASDDSEK